jgi:hypothetical protein
MRKFIRISLYVILASFVFIQFFRPDKNLNDEISAEDFLEMNRDMPPDLKMIFKNSCYDCHPIILYIRGMLTSLHFHGSSISISGMESRN